MLKVTIVLGAILVLFVAETTCQRFIQPTYRPPRRKPVLIRVAREADELKANEEDAPAPSLREEELLDRAARSLDSPSAKRGVGSHSTSSGSHDTGATHPGYNRRNARSLDSPSAKRGGGSPRTSGGSRNSGITHPGYNRRNAREIRLPGHLNPLRPKPLFPRPSVPAPAPHIPIYARTTRDIHISEPRKPTHRDVKIPNWNPHIKTSPLDSLGGRGRHRRSVDFVEDNIDDADWDVFPHY